MVLIMAIFRRKKTFAELTEEHSKLKKIRLREEERAKLRVQISTERSKIKVAKGTKSRPIRKRIQSYARGVVKTARKMQPKKKRGKKSIWEI